MTRVRTHSEKLTLEGYLEMDPWGDPSVDARVRRIHDPLFREYPCL